jgi:ABC-2 type transport system permease protein
MTQHTKQMRSPKPAVRPITRHNLGTVVDFEFTRTVKKGRFWIATLAIPLVIAVAFLLIFLSNSATTASEEAQKNAEFSISYIDNSGLVTPQQASVFGATPAASSEEGIRAVQSGTVDSFFEFPGPSSSTIKVYGADQGIFENNKYSAVAQKIFSDAAAARIGSPELAAWAGGGATTDLKTYRGAAESGGIGSVIPPLLFLVIFYVSIVLLSNQMLNSTLEEKENRVTEMILTTLNPTTLIIGKIIALFMVGLVQMLVFLAPIAFGYLLFRERLALPDFDLSTLVFEPGPLMVGALLLLGGFTLFTGVLVAIGAVMPTAKDAGTIFGPLMLMMFIPFYAGRLIVSDPSAPIVQAFTYFPLSAPVTAMLRNGFGTLGAVESAIVIAELFIVGILVLRLAVHLFRYGSIEYSNKLSIAGTFRKRKALTGK